MEVPRFHRLNKQYLQLQGSNCSNCEIKHFPPRDVCPDCGEVSGRHQTPNATQNVEATYSSARITNPGFNGNLQDPNSRKVMPYSETLKNDTHIGEKEIPEQKRQIIYQASLSAAD